MRNVLFSIIGEMKLRRMLLQCVVTEFIWLIIGLDRLDLLAAHRVNVDVWARW